MKKTVESPSGPWGICIRTQKKKIIKVVPRKEGESLKACLERTKKIAKVIRKKYIHRDDVKVEIISRQKAFPKPEDVRLRKGELWCPYCRKPRKFRKWQTIEIDGIEYPSSDYRCIVCGMSTRDFWVRTYNNLW